MESEAESLSSPDEMAMLPSYEWIIGTGPIAVPLIFEKWNGNRISGLGLVIDYRRSILSVKKSWHVPEMVKPGSHGPIDEILEWGGIMFLNRSKQHSQDPFV